MAASRSGFLRKGGALPYTIRCADTGVNCPGSFTTETKEELVKHMELHAREAHPEVDLQPGQIDVLASGGLIQSPD